MSLVDICPSCGAVNEPNVAFCGACAAPMHAAPLANRSPALPVKWTPPPAVALGATLLTLRVGQWLAKRVWQTWQAQRHAAHVQPRPKSGTKAPQRAHVRIRRRWAWGTPNGLREWGEEDIIIE
nr:zinc ribbon domain-containing protein [Ardenticatena sp.]